MFQMEYVVIGTFSNRLMCVAVKDLESSSQNLRNGSEVFFEVASEFFKGRILFRGGKYIFDLDFCLIQFIV